MINLLSNFIHASLEKHTAISSLCQCAIHHPLCHTFKLLWSYSLPISLLNPFYVKCMSYILILNNICRLLVLHFICSQSPAAQNQPHCTSE